MKLTYKIVAAALALIVVAVIIFTPLVYVRIQSVAAQLLVGIGQALDNDVANEIAGEGEIPDHIGIDISISGLFDRDAKGTAELIKIFSESSKSDASEVIELLIAPLITFAVVLALLVICAIVTAVLAFVVKDNRKVIYSSVAGIFLSLMAPESFEAVSEPFLNGTITLSKIAGDSWISLLGDIDKIEFDSTFWFVPVIFGAVILWTIFYNYTLPADEKKKRLEMIGEADEK